MANSEQPIQDEKLLNLLPGHVNEVVFLPNSPEVRNSEGRKISDAHDSQEGYVEGNRVSKSKGLEHDVEDSKSEVEGKRVSKSRCGTVSAASNQQLTAKFQEERDIIIEQLRKSLNGLFLRQAERFEHMHCETNCDPSPRAASKLSAHIAPDFLPEDNILEDKSPSNRKKEVKQLSFANGVRTSTARSSSISQSRTSISSSASVNTFMSTSEIRQTDSRRGSDEAQAFKQSKLTPKSPQSARFSDLENARKRMSVACHTTDYDLVALQTDNALPMKNLSHFIKSSRFEMGAAVLLFSNIVLLGVQVEIQANLLSENDLPEFQTINAIYCVAFVTELSLRSFAYGKRYLWGPDMLWNWFDLVVVMMQVGEIVVGFTTTLETGSTFSFFGRLVRIARVARVVRAIRIMRFLRGFKVLIDAIYGTLCSCVWALLLLLIIIYVFSLIFAQFSSDFLAGKTDRQSEYEVLEFYFGNFSSSMFTLLKAIIGGIDWEVCVVELSKIGSSLVILFSFYVTLMQFVVINVIAGLFLQSAIEQAQQDQDHVIQLRLQEKQHYVDKLKTLFNELDSSHDGLVSLPEFEAHLQQEKVQAFFAGLEIENADAWTIFKLLDTDGGGAVDYTEFVEGCIRLKGNAKSIEMAQLMYHHKWIMDKVCEVSQFLYSTLNSHEPAEKAQLLS